MEKFIYVFSGKDADRLIELNYTMLCSDEISHKYVFLNKAQMEFSEFDDIQFVMSDMLTFHI